MGWGKTGNGKTGATGERSREPRGCTNKIEAVFQDSIITTFDAPPRGTKLEGATGPGAGWRARPSLNLPLLNAQPARSL